jgi:hypothetical protein
VEAHLHGYPNGILGLRVPAQVTEGMPPSLATARESRPFAASTSRPRARWKFVFPQPFGPTTRFSPSSRVQSFRIDRYPSTSAIVTGIADSSDL